MKVRTILASVVTLLSFSLSACYRDDEGRPPEHHKIVLTSPVEREVVITQRFVCQIHSQRHIEVRALQEGYLEAISVTEGQVVKQFDVMFKVVPALYKARWDAEVAEARFANVEFVNTEKLYEKNVVSSQELELYRARLAKAQAKANLAEAELKFTEVKAPFDGIIDRLRQQQGSLVKKEDLLTTLSDNSTMWVYFNVPEARYLEYMTQIGSKSGQNNSQIQLVDSRIELMLANGSKFENTPGKFLTVEGKFNNETGNIAFRADFPNPAGLLRHGQTGTILLHRSMKNAVVIPQRATFEILEKQYVWVVGEDQVAHQRPITIAHELEDIYVIKSGLGLNDKIVLEGVPQVHENDKLEDVDFQKLGETLGHQKYPAE
jgi:membrane fusion protein (multidrug efflux system)